MYPNRLSILPIAIIVAGLILAVTIFFVRAGDSLGTPQNNLSALRPVSPSDHIIGSPDAPVIIIEYSDIDCAYCKQFQATMTQIMNDYAPTGNVAWVYRHFPSVNLHPFATTHAEAAECAASIAGENAFWRFIDALLQAAPGGDQFNPVGYPPVLQNLGIPQTDFDACMAADTFGDRITADFENALAIGGTGTPFSIIVIRGSEPIVISGAIPYRSMKEVIDTALSKATPK